MPSLISHFYRMMLRSAPIFGHSNDSMIALRERIERAARLAKPPRWLAIAPVDAGGVPAEWQLPPGAARDRAILYIHGGAWTLCSPRTHRRISGHLARAAGMPALSLDYRLAPEHPFPAALDDCLAAYRWLRQEGFPPGRIVFAGDSAGGNLALAALLALRDLGEPLPAAAACLSPATDLAGTGESTRTRARVEVLLRGAGGKPSISEMYTAGRDPCEPLISPLYGDLRGLPPILIHVGDHEILLDDSTRFVERARAAGVQAEVVVWPGMWHVFQMHAPGMPEARRSLEQLGAFLKQHTA